MKKIFLWSHVYVPDSPKERVVIVTTKSDFDALVKYGVGIIYQEENMSRFVILYHLNEEVSENNVLLKKNEFLTDASDSTLCKLQLLLD